MTPADRLIVALDAPDMAACVRLARRLRGIVRRVKVGSILFAAAGPAAVARMRALGFDVFLDLKFHDIPSTVEKSCQAAARHGAWMMTVHAVGGADMLRAAVAGARQGARRAGTARPRVVGVTVLTSAAASPARVVALARDAARAGLDGIVASAQEARAIRRAIGPRRLIVCPGIRPADGRADDQRRVATPRQALNAGADFLVVGRPITEARDPAAAARAILQEMIGEAAS